MQKRESNQPSKRRGRKPKAKPEGLGDVVEIITEATGIKKLVKLFTPDGEDCGCDKRKETLNKISTNYGNQLRILRSTIERNT
jgi:hypothetical protein